MVGWVGGSVSRWINMAGLWMSRFFDVVCISSHPIEVPVGHPSEIDEIFDLISYSKGASVIRMLHDWIGDKVRNAVVQL